MENTITPRAKDYSQWYLDVIAAADLADNSPVRGSMVIKPNGYAIWERIQQILDGQFKALGVQNAYFPLFIPKSFLEKEAEHVAGFAKECAVVTHHRLKQGKGNTLVPDAELEEPLIVRPTSETIMYAMFAKWIESFRDLPLKINQWVNIVRWELRTRPFLRTLEFLWQEGHTAHALKSEAEAMTLQMLEVYRAFLEEYLAIPVLAGYKSESEKFAGAEYTAAVEAMMQDGKALQLGTSHFLGQNFAKAFGIQFTSAAGQREYAWQTSWGMSTRVIGGLIMTHADDRGLVLPPKIAPLQVVIVPIFPTDADRPVLVKKARALAEALAKAGLRVQVDEREGRPGSKFYLWEKRGVPVRLELGPRDLKAKQVVAVRRDTGQKLTLKMAGLGSALTKLLGEIQVNLFKRALACQKSMTKEVAAYAALKEFFNGASTGFALAAWCGGAACEAKVKAETTATIRVLPLQQSGAVGSCVVCSQAGQKQAVFAKAY